MIWLALLISAALTSVGLTFPDLTATNADAATLTCAAAGTCASTASNDYSFASPANSWAVVGARSTAATGDPRVCLYADAGFTQQRACSNFTSLFGGVEFVVVDGHHSPAGTAFERTDRVSGSGEICTQLECGATTLVVNNPAVTQSWGTGDIVRVYNVPVTAGKTYRADLVVTSGTTDFGLALFDSQGQAGYAAGRDQAVTSADRRGTGQGEGIYFTAGATDTLGLVLWGNNAGTSAGFRIEVRTATPLVSNAPVLAPGDSQRDWFAVPSDPRGWAVLALRPGATTDADLRQYDAPDYLNLVGKSNAVAGAVDFIVTDYANVPEDTSSVLEISLGPIGSYLMDWAEHPRPLDATAIEPVSIAGRVGIMRALGLVAGVQYQFEFDPDDGTTGDISLGVYGPTLAKPHFTYGTRADSLAGSDAFGTSPPGGWTAGDGIETFYFTPAVTDTFLLFCYQKTSAAVSGNLWYFPTTLLGVGDRPPGPAALALSAAWPSPARAGESVRFRCQAPVSCVARLEIVDVRGRTVAVAFRGVLPAGPSELSWDGRTAGGAPAPAGVYFARLVAAGHGASVRRISRLG